MRLYHGLRTVIKPNMVHKRKLEWLVEGVRGAGQQLGLEREA